MINTNFHTYCFEDLKKYKVNQEILNLPDKIKDVKIGGILCERTDYEEKMKDYFPIEKIGESLGIEIKKINKVTVKVTNFDETNITFEQIIDYD